jgi:hypothetical protein
MKREPEIAFDEESKDDKKIEAKFKAKNQNKP